MSDDVTLTIAGTTYGGWTKLDIVRSIETIAGSFSLSVTERWPGQQAVSAILPGSPCKVAIGGETIITGFVDDSGPEYDEANHIVEITGRDATGDLVDCSLVIKTLEIAGGPVDAMIRTITERFVIPVSSQIPVPSLKLRYAVQYGETAFEAIERIAAMAAVLPTSDGQGGIVLTRAGLGGERAGIKLGKNIRRAKGRYSFKNRFSEYIVSGQAAAGDQTDPAVAAFGTGRATDPNVKRYRPLIVMAQIQDAAPGLYQRRAEWESTVRLGRSWQSTITVTGWRDSAGVLWAPNTLVRVDDDFQGMHDTLLISGVRLTLDENGTLAQLTVTRREAFDLIPMSTLGVYDPAPPQPRIFPPGAPKGGGL